MSDRPAPKPGRGWFRRSVSWGAILIVLASAGVSTALFLAIGGVDVSADKPDGWITRNLLPFVFKRSEAARAAEVTAPDDLWAPSRARLEAQHFDMVCANCHGRPGYGQSVTALSMSPRPQYLPKVVGQFTDRELYQIVEHGVKFSAMPSWPTGRRDDEVWSMVAFLRQLPKLDARAYAEMTALPTTAATAPTAVGGDATLRPANPRRNTPPVDEFLYAAPAAGFSDQTVHATPAATCARCHGPDGSGAVTGGEAPNLTIQDAAHLQAALAAYTHGSRKSGFMQTIAASDRQGYRGGGGLLCRAAAREGLVRRTRRAGRAADRDHERHRPRPDRREADLRDDLPEVPRQQRPGRSQGRIPGPDPAGGAPCGADPLRVPHPRQAECGDARRYRQPDAGPDDQPGGVRERPGAAAWTTEARRGRGLARRGHRHPGRPSRGVPARLGCHGAQGVADLPLIPRLQGQNAFYLRHRLDTFARPEGANLSALNPMPLIARRLTNQERADLAAYFAAAAPLAKPAARP